MLTHCDFTTDKPMIGLASEMVVARNEESNEGRRSAMSFWDSQILKGMEENEDVLKLRSEAIEEAKNRGVSGEFLTFLKNASLDSVADEIRRKVNYKLSVSGEQAHVLLLQAIRECFVIMPNTQKRKNSRKYLLDRWESRKTRKGGDPEELEVYETPVEDCKSRQNRKENGILDKNCTFCGICMKKGLKSMFSNARQVVAHMEKFHGYITLFTCSFCAKCYTTKDGYVKHECAQFEAFKQEQKNNAYQTEFAFALCGLICADCGKMHLLRSNIDEQRMHDQKNSMIEFFKYHNSNEMVMIQMVSEKEFHALPSIQIYSSLNANMQISCSECKIESFSSVEEKREHFALVHSASSTLSCPHDNCDVQHTDEVQLKKHILEEHVRNGMMGFFMKHHAAVHVGKPENIVGYVAPCVVTGKKAHKENFFVGGVNTNDFSYRLPPTKFAPPQQGVHSVTRDVLKSLTIPPSLIDLERNEAGLKISTKMFIGAGKKPKTFGSEMCLTNGFNDDTVEKMTIKMDSMRDCEIEIPLEVHCENSQKKKIRMMLGYCMECHRILNGQRCIEEHGTRSCNFEKIRILSKIPPYQNKTLLCPICRDTVCSIDGLIFHVFDVHGRFCNYDCDENESVKTIVIGEETRRVNLSIGLGELGVNTNDPLNALIPRDSYVGTILAENKAKKRKPSFDSIFGTSAKKNASESSDPTLNQPSTSTPASLSPVEEDNVEQDPQFVTIRKQRAIDVAEMWSESGLNGDDAEEIPTNSHSSAVDNRSRDDNSTADNTKEDTTCVTFSKKQVTGPDAQPARESDLLKPTIIRVEPVDNTPNVEYNHKVENDELYEMDDDAIVLVEMTSGNIHRVGANIEENFSAAGSHQEIFEENGDDECMAVAQITNHNRVETTKSRRKATLNCPKCSSKFMTKTNLDYHFKKYHGQDTIDDLLETDYGVPLCHSIHLCLNCGTGFQSLEAYNKHMAKHKNHTEKKCDICPGLLCDADTNHTHDDCSFVCGTCEPQESFEIESQLLFHLYDVHKVQLIFYCKKCYLAHCSPDKFFYNHLIDCWPDYAKRTLPQLFAVMSASTWTYQPADEEQHKRLLAENPEKYTYVSDCAHRSVFRLGKTLYTCPEVSSDGKSICSVLISNFRYFSLRESSKIPPAIHKNSGTPSIHKVVWESWKKKKLPQHRGSKRSNQMPSTLLNQPQVNNNSFSQILPNSRRNQACQSRQQPAPVEPTQSSSLLTQRPAPIIPNQITQQTDQSLLSPVISSRRQVMQVDQRQLPPVLPHQSVREIQQHQLPPLVHIQPPHTLVQHQIMHQQQNIQLHPVFPNQLSSVHGQPRRQQLPQLPLAVPSQINRVPVHIERSLAHQSHIPPHGQETLQRFMNQEHYHEQLKITFESLSKELRDELIQCRHDLSTVIGFPYAEVWMKVMLQARLSSLAFKQAVNSKAHNQFLHLLLLQNGEVCIFCGNEHAHKIRKFPITDGDLLINRLTFYYHAEDSNRRQTFTWNDILSVLQLRMFFVKYNESHKFTPPIIAVCEEHCVGNSSNLENQMFHNFPDAFLPTPNKRLNPPLFDQIQTARLAKGNSLKLRDEISFMLIVKTASTINNLCANPLWLMQGQNQNVLQTQAPFAQIPPHFQQVPPQPQIRLVEPKNVKDCDFCKLNGVPVALDERLLINLGKHIPAGWIRMVESQLSNQSATSQKEYIRVLRDKNSRFCIRHFVPQACDIIDNKLVFNENVQNWPLIDITKEENVHQDLKLHLESFLQLMVEGTISSRLSDGLVVLQKLNKCAQPNCLAELKTTQELAIHKMHFYQDYFLFCYQCMTTFSGSSEKDILNHFTKVHKVKDENVQRKLTCPIRECSENNVHNSTLLLRLHIPIKHRDVMKYSSVCGLTFTTAEERDEHDTKHTATKTLECCVICTHVGSQTILIGDQILRHELIHGCDIRSFCKLCGIIVENALYVDSYHQHFIEEHTESGKCKVCLVVANDDHIKTHKVLMLRPFDKIIDNTEKNSFELVVQNT